MSLYTLKKLLMHFNCITVGQNSGPGTQFSLCTDVEVEFTVTPFVLHIVNQQIVIISGHLTSLKVSLFGLYSFVSQKKFCYLEVTHSLIFGSEDLFDHKKLIAGALHKHTVSYTLTWTILASMISDGKEKDPTTTLFGSLEPMGVAPLLPPGRLLLGGGRSTTCTTFPWTSVRKKRDVFFVWPTFIPDPLHRDVNCPS